MKVISKTEFAENLGVTRQTILNWIYGNKKCYRELKKIGWNEDAKTWKPAEQQILIKYFG